MPASFGTDGIRGVADVEVTTGLAAALGRAAAAVLPGDRWLIGSDGRASGPRLVAALAGGLRAAGRHVLDLGVLPTPGVAFLSQRDGVPAAIVSASHNPWTDNGIKLLAAGGRKLSDAVEAEIATRLEGERTDGVGTATTDGVGTATTDGVGTATTVGPGGAGTSAPSDAVAAYAGHLVASLQGRRLDGMRLVIDCANGASSGVAPGVFRSLGAEVTVLNAAPDGTNINAGCGSTYPAALQTEVVARKADAGLAFDGDADRVLAVDHLGALVDGDHVLAICATDLQRRGLLRGDTVVVTVMSNLGLRLALAAAGIGLVETAVGDRYVLDAMAKGGFALGGEQSGHIIFADLATTGDGLLTGLQLLDAVVRAGRPLAEIAGSVMTRLPQVLRNVVVDDRDALAEATEVWALVADIEATFAGRGRVLLRPSGTEPLIRVMVEAPTEPEAVAVADRLVEAVRRALGSGARK